MPSVPEGCHNATGATVGGQIGYRWQATNWVFGLEAQGNWADFRGSNASQYAVFGTTSLLNDVTKVDAFGLFTGQVGYAFNNVLLYAKGGAAVVHDKYSLTLTPAGAAALAPLFTVVAGQTGAVGSETRWGGTVGAGIEFGFAPGWSVAVEYDHLFMGSRDVTTNTIAPFAAPPSTHRISQDIDHRHGARELHLRRTGGREVLISSRTRMRRPRSYAGAFFVWGEVFVGEKARPSP